MKYQCTAMPKCRGAFNIQMHADIEIYTSTERKFKEAYRISFLHINGNHPQDNLITS